LTGIPGGAGIEQTMATRAEEKAAQDIIRIGKTAYDKNLVAARAGNLSIRLGDGRFMITGQGAALGFLSRRELIITGLDGRKIQGAGGPSFETGLHAALYKNPDVRAVVHLHPPCTLALTEARRVINPVTFEAALYLGVVPVIAQEAPNVIDTAPVAAALTLNNIVILKNHGVVSAGETLRDAFFLAELLEESARMNMFTSLLPQADTKAAGSARAAKRRGAPVALFSKKHRLLLQAAVSSRQRPAMGSRLSLRMKADDTGDEYTAVIGQAGLPASAGHAQGALAISGNSGAWKNIFNGRMDLFTAVIQNKMRLAGSLQELLRWYPALSPLFRRWQAIPVIE
jgi:L-fuculose-phosphate aldolase